MKLHTPDQYEFIAGGGDMGKLIRSVDWSKTPVGEPGKWPQSLRTAISIMLETHFPMYIAWGKSFTQFYNDGYRPILGSTRHPRAMGISTRETFAEIWDTIGPMFEGVMQGKAVEFNEYMLPLDRHGYMEECYFIFSYSPIRDETGGVGGVLVTVTETTNLVTGERRLKTLRNLADRASEAKNIHQACEMVLRTAKENAYDIPFALCYQLDESGNNAILTGSVRLDDHPALAQATIDLSRNDVTALPLAKVVQTGKPILITGLSKQFPGLPGGAWPESSHTACIIPVSRPEKEQPYGILVLGVSPRKVFDDDYKGFFKLFTDHTASAIGNALAYEAERNRTEALLEIDRLKTAFFSNVSHEFRTPLTLMIGPLEEALKESSGVSSKKDKERLQLIHRNAQRLLKMVNSLLDFSRIEAGRMQAYYQPTDLAGLTTDLAGSFRSAIEKGGIEYTVACNPLSEPVYVDRNLWEKIVLNLLSNAYKYTFKGEIKIQLQENNGSAELMVADTGTGIPGNELPHIFERFHRVQNARGRTHEGTGIGLSLIQELVKLHGGTVSVQSEYDKGSTFTVSVPFGTLHLPAGKIGKITPVEGTKTPGAYLPEMNRWSNGNGVAPTESVIQKEINNNRRYILVADDNADMRDYIAHLLGNQYNVETVQDGKAALAAVQKRIPDLVIADVMMPLVDGFELLEQLKTNSRTQSVPVVMLSARAGEEAKVEGIAAGADDYLVKPFSAAELLAVIKTNLSIAGMHREINQKLLNERQKFYHLLMQAPVSIFIVRGTDFITELVNTSCLQILDVKEEDILDKPLLEAVPELKGQGYEELLTGVLQTGEPVFGREMPITLNRFGKKETGYFNFVYQPLREQDGTITGVMQAGYDVTEMVLTRNKTEESETYFRKMTDTVPVMIWLTQQDGHCTYLNKRWYDYTGEAPEAVTGFKWLSVIHPDDRWHAEQIIREGINKQSPFSLEYRLRGADGKYQWMYDSGAPRYNNHGELEGFIGSIININKRKIAENAVIESETRFRQLADSMPQIVWTADPDGYTDYYNKQWYSIMGVKEKFGDESFLEVLHPGDRTIALDTWYRVVKTGEPYEIEYRFNVKQPVEGYRWFLARALPIKDGNGRIIKWFGTCTDIDDVKRIEQSLRESEERFRTVADSAPVLVWMAGTDKRCNFFNRGWLEFTGRTMQQEWGDGWTEGVHPDDLTRCIEIYTQSFDARNEFEMEYRLLRHDKKYRWVLDHGIPRYSHDGVFLGYIGSCIDIHERKETREELERLVTERTNEIMSKKEVLKQQNDFIHTVLDSSVDVIAVLDNEMRYITLNKKFLELYGVQKEEALGRKITELFPQTKDTITHSSVQKALKGELVHLISHKSVVVNRHFETYFIPLFNSHNEVYGVMLIAHDNTPIIEAADKLMRTNAELTNSLEELRQSEERYQKMTNVVEDYAILVLDKEGNVLNWNKGAEKIKGYTADEIIGRNFRVFYPLADQQNQLPENLIREAATKGKSSYEGWRVRKDGKTFWGNTVITTLHNENNVIIGFSKVTRDLTERKLAEDKLRMYADQLEFKNKELERSNAELTSFSYVASHDLQEPLRKIQAFGNLILEHDKNNISDTGKDYFARMIKAATRMQNLIDSLLEFSRTATTHKKFEETDINILLDEVKKELHELVEDNHAVINSNKLPVLFVIPFQFKQLLSNLITNSIKYAKQGVDPVIDITGSVLEAVTLKKSGNYPSSEYFELVIRDNGIGFEQEYADKVFELFQRLHGRNEYQGSGIGLAICKKIAENHNGLITAESEPGKGATFRFFMPVVNKTHLQN